MTNPEVIIIAALTEKNHVIGIENKLPWYIPDDLKRFKKLTLGHSVLMGRKTFDSIIARNKKPLPDRLNVVLSRSKSFDTFPIVRTYRSVEAAIAGLSDQQRINIIGGASLYRVCLDFADRLELTIVEQEYAGDAFFPPYEHLIGSHFNLLASEQHNGYRFETYQRI